MARASVINAVARQLFRMNVSLSGLVVRLTTTNTPPAFKTAKMPTTRFDRVRKMDGYTVAPGDSQILQAAGEMIGGVLQLRVGEPGARTDQRHLVREPAGAVMEEVLNEHGHPVRRPYAGEVFGAGRRNLDRTA